MRRIRIIGLVAATLGLLTAVGLPSAGFPSAGAHWEPWDPVPPVPGVGEPRGITGPGPRLTVSGGPVLLGRGNSIHVEVRCITSTEYGCSGDLELTTRDGLHVAAAGFELDERQGESVFLTLPADGKRLARHRNAWKLRAQARATDSLGRAATDTSNIMVRGDRRR